MWATDDDRSEPSLWTRVVLWIITDTILSHDDQYHYRYFLNRRPLPQFSWSWRPFPFSFSFPFSFPFSFVSAKSTCPTEHAVYSIDFFYVGQLTGPQGCTHTLATRLFHLWYNVLIHTRRRSKFNNTTVKNMWNMPI